MVDMKNLKALALHSAKGTAPTNFSSENVNDAFREELGKVCSDYITFMKNRYDLYDLMITTIDEVVPAKTIAELGAFAEIQTVGQGQKAVFKRKLGRNRAKKFVTQVGLSGLYETFRLDAEEFTVSAHAIGGAVRIDFERMLDGAETIAEYMDIVNEAMLDAVYYEVQKALISSFNSGIGAGVKSADGKTDFNRSRTFVNAANFEAKSMQNLITIVKSYGNGAVIFATPEFVGEMADSIAIVKGGDNYQGIYHPQDIDDIYKTGFITMFRGTPIVQLRQSYTDDSHEYTWLNPQYAFVLPTNGEKVVKIVFEGKTQVRDWTNVDGSMEMHIYKKLGAAILSTHNWGIYRNYNIANTQSHFQGLFSNEELGLDKSKGDR
jgi:hypothetical protein